MTYTVLQRTGGQIYITKWRNERKEGRVIRKLISSTPLYPFAKLQYVSTMDPQELVISLTSEWENMPLEEWQLAVAGKEGKAEIPLDPKRILSVALEWDFSSGGEPQMRVLMRLAPLK